LLKFTKTKLNVIVKINTEIKPDPVVVDNRKRLVNRPHRQTDRSNDSLNTSTLC